MTAPDLTLASASPRRRELLARLGNIAVLVEPSEIDETPFSGELPRDYAVRMAREKAIACKAVESFVLAGDTVVAVGRRILPKADSRDIACKCLTLLSGRRHRVFSSVAVCDPAGMLRTKLSETMVQFKRLSAGELNDYLAGEEWQGKAGGYAIQGAAEGLIKTITGSHSGVMGLPLYETRILLKSAGFPIA